MRQSFNALSYKLGILHVKSYWATVKKYDADNNYHTIYKNLPKKEKEFHCFPDMVHIGKVYEFNILGILPLSVKFVPKYEKYSHELITSAFMGFNEHQPKYVAQRRVEISGDFKQTNTIVYNDMSGLYILISALITLFTFLGFIILTDGQI